MKIRKATKKDINDIYPLFIELINSEEKNAGKVAKFLKDIRKKRKDFGKNSRKELLKDIVGRNSFLFLAEDNGKVVGYISGKIIKDSFFNQITVGYFNHIFVLKNYRSKGILRKLYFLLEKEFMKRKCEVSLLEVFSTNPAIKAFEKLDYKISTHKMWKKLK